MRTRWADLKLHCQSREGTEVLELGQRARGASSLHPPLQLCSEALRSPWGVTPSPQEAGQGCLSSPLNPWVGQLLFHTVRKEQKSGEFLGSMSQNIPFSGSCPGTSWMICQLCASWVKAVIIYSFCWSMYMHKTRRRPILRRGKGTLDFSVMFHFFSNCFLFQLKWYMYAVLQVTWYHQASNQNGSRYPEPSLSL